MAGHIGFCCCRDVAKFDQSGERDLSRRNVGSLARGLSATSRSGACWSAIMVSTPAHTVPRSNRSLSIFEPLSDCRKRKSERQGQRPAPKMSRFGSNSRPFARQRLRQPDLSRRNVGGFSTPGIPATKTELHGWPYRIRTSMCREKIQPFEPRQCLGFEPLSQTVPPF
jgi:hypothetical protein